MTSMQPREGDGGTGEAVRGIANTPDPAGGTTDQIGVEHVHNAIEEVLDAG